MCLERKLVRRRRSPACGCTWGWRPISRALLCNRRSVSRAVQWHAWCARAHADPSQGLAGARTNGTAGGALAPGPRRGADCLGLVGSPFRDPMRSMRETAARLSAQWPSADEFWPGAHGDADFAAALGLLAADQQIEALKRAICRSGTCLVRVPATCAAAQLQPGR